MSTRQTSLLFASRAAISPIAATGCVLPASARQALCLDLQLLLLRAPRA